MNVDVLTTSQLEAERNRRQSRIGEKTVELEEEKREFAQVCAELEKRKRRSADPRLTDHALLRYIERIYGVDIKALKARILSPDIIAGIKAGASAVHVDAVKFVVKDNVIVTVYEPQAVNNNHKKLRDTGKKAIDHIAEQMGDVE